MDELQVGATVRVTRLSHPRWTSRALLATLHEDNGTCVVIWEDLAPKPLCGQIKAKFLVTPLLKSRDFDDCAEQECLVDQRNVQSLLPFELPGNDQILDAIDSSDVNTWKNCGDRLLRLGDATSACAYFEMALTLSSPEPKVGCTVIVKRNGFTDLAEIDCVNDENNFDVTFVKDSSEITVDKTHILLTVNPNDIQQIQGRVLLNLCRCLMKLADVDRCDLGRKLLYIKRALLASTLAVTLAKRADINPQNQGSTQSSHHSEPCAGLCSLLQTALILRSQVQAQLGKHDHAVADLQHLLRVNPNHREGRTMLHDIERQKAKKKIADKKLVKQICRWIDQATENAR